MRTGKIEINGKEYLLCFSTRVVRACSERYGGVENIDKALMQGTEANMMDESFWLLATMMDAGARYAKLNGIETPPPLSYDDLYDLCDVDDLMGMKTKIFETVASGSEREIDTEPENEKNGDTTRQSFMSGGTSGTD
ncbi:MAG: hypothetical protein ACI4AO_08390 [Anaerotignum sp.]